MAKSVIWEAAIAPYRRYRDYFAEMIRSGVARETLHADDPDLVALRTARVLPASSPDLRGPVDADPLAETTARRD